MRVIQVSASHGSAPPSPHPRNQNSGLTHPTPCAAQSRLYYWSSALHCSMSLAIVKRIRETEPGDGTQFDLAGFDASNAKQLVEDAFGTPLPSGGPARVSLVVGAGKQGRQKYDPDLHKALFSALGDIGFSEDRAASVSDECVKTYKYQHDTGKNLFFVHIYPPYFSSKGASEGDTGATGHSAEEGSITPENLCISCSLDAFREACAHKICSWSQKRQLMKCMQDTQLRTREIEGKMSRLEQLTDEEQLLYDMVQDVEEKQQWLASDIKSMVDAGSLTAQEREQALSQIDAKLASSKGEQQKRLQARKDHIKAIHPMEGQIKHQQEIEKIAIQLARIDKLENIRGRLLTMAEVKEAGLKEELQERLMDLEQDSMGWFNDEKAFHEQLEKLKSKAVSAAASAAAKRASGAKKSNKNEWETVGSSKGSSGSGRRR
jgi:hypothetical protein